MEKYCSYIKKFTEPSHHYNVFSVVLFLMEKSYKDPIKKYFENLRSYVGVFRKIFGETFYLRIYYDKSIYSPVHKDPELNEYITKKLTKFVDDLEKYKYVQLIEYSCPKFNYKNIYHLGLYGTLQRFIPIFDFVDNKNIDTVMIADVDSHIDSLGQFNEQYKFMQENNYKFLYGSSCKPLRLYQNTGNILRETRDYWMSAGRIITSLKFPKKLFLDFQEALLENNKEIKEYFNRDYEYKKIFPTTDIQYIYSYGIDEYFLNHPFRDYLTEKNTQQVVYCVPKLSHIFWNHQRTNNNYKNIKKSTEELLTQTFRNIFGKIWNNRKSLSENLDSIPDAQYYHTNVENTICSLIKKISNDYEKYLFTEELYEFAKMECCALKSFFFVVIDKDKKKIVCL
jgi:hypothetical protein